MTSFDAYLANIPLLHSWDGGVTWNTGGFQAEHLLSLQRFLKSRLPASPRILETGAGNSTITFLFLSPSKLVSIAPEQSLYERIVRYCEANDVSADSLEAHVARSEWVLPKLCDGVTDEKRFDFILIDGGHNWPMVFVDFFYCNYLLKPGGFLMIDDVQLHSVKELARLLTEQPGFTLALDLGKSLVFQRTSPDPFLGEWSTEPYIVRKTNEYAASGSPFSL